MGSENNVLRDIWRDRTSYLMVAPFAICFFIFIVLPVLAIGLSLRHNMVQAPKFVGLANYVTLFTEDDIFMTHVLPNTFTFALLVGPGGYIWLSSLLG